MNTSGPGPDLFRITHAIESCRHCGQRHVFGVVVRTQRSPATATPLFGGPPAAITLAFSCPTTGKLLSEAVAAPANTDVVGMDDPQHPAPEYVLPSPLSPPASNSGEYEDWIKTSRATALDFCKTMLTAATGAVPVYFAVIKYVDTGRAPSWFSAIRALPPLLFLAAAVLFALALRPRFGTISPDGFAEFRAKRLRQLDRAMVFGLSLFVVGVLLSIALAATLLT